MINCLPLDFRFSHEVYDCQERCLRQLSCGHVCAEVCSAGCKADCLCEENIVADDHNVQEHRYNDKSRTIPRDRGFPILKSSQSTSRDLVLPISNSENRRPPRSFDPSRQLKAYNDYAEGGHVASDRAFAKKMEDEAAEAHRMKQEMDLFENLFGGSPKPTQNTNAKSVQKQTDDSGTKRFVYREIFKPGATAPNPQPKSCVRG